MTTSMNGSGQRIPWRKRADLQSSPVEFEGRQSWAIKDPLTLGYFELKEEEFFVFSQLDGQVSAQAICEAFHRQFMPRTLAENEVQNFVGLLVSQGLVAADRSGYGRMLVDRAHVGQWRRRWLQATNLLAIRFRGIDPDRFLGWLLARLAWMFSPWAFVAGLIIIASAVTLVVVQFEELMQRLPDANAILNTSNLLWMALLLAVVKLLHEIGHGLTCKYFGGECREIGLLLLVFVPTLYCNVSDIWMVQNKWKRIAVSAAGMWTEALIASGCTLLWWFSVPGLFHSLCLNLMFICGVSTFLFNGNPLLRYDGYFVLADWLEIPNFQQQSFDAVRRKLTDWYCFQSSPLEIEVRAGRQWLLLGYGVCSAVYRYGLSFMILWSLHRWLEPYGLGFAVQLFAAVTIGLMVLGPITSMVRFLKTPAVRMKMDWMRFGLRTTMTAVLLLIILCIPLPHRVTAGALLDQDSALPVYVTLDGMLMRGVKVGERVDAGEELARLDNPRIEEELLRLEGEVLQHQVRLSHLEARRIVEPEASQNIPAVRESIRDLQQQLLQLRSSAERLVLRSPVAGIVLPTPRQPAPLSSGTLASWSGNPLGERNIGCYLQSGTIICRVGRVESRMAMALVSQDDINLVQVGQSVRLRWSELAGEIMTGKVVEISALDLDLFPPDAVTRLNLPARTESGGLRPIGIWYQARIQLDDSDAPLLRGSAGQAKIQTDPVSLASRLRRWFNRTFPL